MLEKLLADKDKSSKLNLLEDFIGILKVFKVNKAVDSYYITKIMPYLNDLHLILQTSLGIHDVDIDSLEKELRTVITNKEINKLIKNAISIKLALEFPEKPVDFFKGGRLIKDGKLKLECKNQLIKYYNFEYSCRLRKRY